MNLKNKAFKLKVADTEKKSQLVDEVTVGSVTIPIFYSPNRTKIPGKSPVVGVADAEPAADEFKTYDSYILVFYEGSQRKTPRRSTLEKAKTFAKEPGHPSRVPWLTSGSLFKQALRPNVRFAPRQKNTDSFLPKCRTPHLVRHIIYLRGTKPLLGKIMNIIQNNETVPVEECPLTGKRALAAYYRVCLRTIEKWFYRGIISGQMNRNKLEFDVADCDRRLLAYKPKTKKQIN